MNLTFFILFDFSSFTPLSPPFSPLPSLILYNPPSSLWPFQNSNKIKWSLICMHLQNIACAVFSIKGMEKRVVVLVGVYVLPHWHQTVLWYGNGRAREEWLLTKALFGYRPRSIPLSFHLSFSIPRFLSQLLSFSLSLNIAYISFTFFPSSSICWVLISLPLRCFLFSLSIILVLSHIV